MPRLSSAEQLYAEQLYEGYLGDSSNFDYRPTLIHGDLSPEHIIYDKSTRKVAGILDFGDVEIGDPDYKLQWLYAHYGDGFLETDLDRNPHPAPVKLLRKLPFFNRANTVGDILIGLHRDDPEIVETSLALLRSQVNIKT